MVNRDGRDDNASRFDFIFSVNMNSAPYGNVMFQIQVPTSVVCQLYAFYESLLISSQHEFIIKLKSEYSIGN